MTQRLPTVFLVAYDTDAELLGFDGRTRIDRLPGETLEQMQERARHAEPDTRVFVGVYEVAK